ncbi:MAG TPA: ABC transporter substrate-binding protein [Chloroflexi bacterium]|nr:ABC transporter substrate-binding protein [Chloroflexota bacterium]
MRKSILIINLLLVLALLFAACTKTPETPAVVDEGAPVVEEEATTDDEAAADDEELAVDDVEEVIVEEEVVVPAKFNEAPMLAEKVAAGELPPVEERLPLNPMVVKPADQIGTYGGDLRYGFTGGPTWGGMLYIAQWEHPVTWKYDFSDFEPNIIESWEANAEGTEYIWYLREGLKWSNGDPYTADDITFMVNDFLFNVEIFPPAGGGADWLPNELREGFSVEKIDDYTVKFIFPAPYGTFMLNLAPWGGRYFAQYPFNYLKQFHADYNPDVDDLVAADDAVEDWVGLFLSKAPATWGDPSYFFDYPELPSLGPWIVTQPVGAGTTLIMERNPYYWKVDTEGNQLPYTDRVVATLYQSDEARTFAMLNGDLDFIKDAGDANRELYFDAVDDGKPLKLLLPNYDMGNMQSIHFNLTTKDPVVSEIFNDINFRIGMSHAINREEIIEVVYKGQGKPAQVCPVESSPLYVERLCNQYLEFDIALANEYLDQVLPDKDAQGFRLRPDGTRFQPIFTVINDSNEGQHWVQVAEILIEHWKVVGIDALLNAVGDTVWNEQREANNIEIFMFHGGEGGSGMTAIIDNRWHVPGSHWGIFGNGWTRWYATYLGDLDEDAVEPPQYVEDIRAMYREAIAQPTREGQVEIMREIMELSADYLWTLGISRAGTTIQPISSRLGNVPETYYKGWLQGFDKILRPEQWYIIQ